MISSYFKKLFSSFFFLFIYALFAMAVAYIWMRVAAICKEQFHFVFGKLFNYSIIGILTLFVELVSVYFIRIDNLKAKERYASEHIIDDYSLRIDFKETLKHNENILHTAAFNTLIFLLFLLVGVGAKITGILLLVFAFLLTIISIVLFVIINTIVWCIVHKNWLNSQKK